MKKNLIIFICAIILGFIFAFYLFLGIDKTVAKSKKIVYFYQVGVFKVYENALNVSKNYESGTIFNEDGLYRVYIAIAKDLNVKNMYEKYFNDNKIIFYARPLNISDKCLKRIDAYEKIIMKSNNTDIILKINREILNYYKEECYD